MLEVGAILQEAGCSDWAEALCDPTAKQAVSLAGLET
jgi:hypothetical protein